MHSKSKLNAEESIAEQIGFIVRKNLIEQRIRQRKYPKSKEISFSVAKLLCQNIKDSEKSAVKIPYFKTNFPLTNLRLSSNYREAGKISSTSLSTNPLSCMKQMTKSMSHSRRSNGKNSNQNVQKLRLSRISDANKIKLKLKKMKAQNEVTKRHAQLQKNYKIWKIRINKKYKTIANQTIYNT